MGGGARQGFGASTAPIAVSGEIEAKYVKIQDVEFDPIQAEDYEVQSPATASVPVPLAVPPPPTRK